MPDIDLHKEYNSTGESVQDLFDRTEEGFFVPLYQREYTWEEDNINQLFDDLVMGTQELTVNGSASTFLGTAILTTLSDKQKAVKVGEVRAQPTAVQIVIDGQQRISTLALLSIQLIDKIRCLRKRLPSIAPYSDLINIGETFVGRLTKLHTIELGKGAKPPSKPKIICAREDAWTYDGDDSTYNSPVAKYIATFIRTDNTDTALLAIKTDSGTRVPNNVRLIRRWLDDIANAHVSSMPLYEQFPVGSAIAKDSLQDFVLGFTDEALKAVVEKAETDDSQQDYYAAATYQILLLTYYLLHRCGVNRLQPTHEDWGFDMFQALNATGIPLTAIETFLPQVMQAEQSEGMDWDKSSSCESMNEVHLLFEATSTNEKKNQRTNELLGTFALCYEGKKLGNKFSNQKRWLTSIFEKELPTIEKKHNFLEKMAQSAKFYYYAWYMDEWIKEHHIQGIEGHPEAELASFLVQYLRDANSKLSAPILSRFYGQALDKDELLEDFVESTKACAAFFTLWRAANSTSGLDDIYRKYFKGNGTQNAKKNNWKDNPSSVSAKDLKAYFLDILQSGGIGEKDAWIEKSKKFLNYSELKFVSRFVLFISGNDRVLDVDNPGLTKVGIKKTCPLLTLKQWKSKDLKSLEHVAPQTPPERNTWDPNIYTNNQIHELGNLILLPQDINSFVDNRNWPVKFIHYSHVGVRERDQLQKLEDSAQKQGIVLSKKAIKVLSKADYICAVEPILQLGEGGGWDTQLISKRTQQIKELAWDTLFGWLNS